MNESICNSKEYFGKRLISSQFMTNYIIEIVRRRILYVHCTINSKVNISQLATRGKPQFFHAMFFICDKPDFCFSDQPTAIALRCLRRYLAISLDPRKYFEKRRPIKKGLLIVLDYTAPRQFTTHKYKLLMLCERVHKCVWLQTGQELKVFGDSQSNGPSQPECICGRLKMSNQMVKPR